MLSESVRAPWWRFEIVVVISIVIGVSSRVSTIGRLRSPCRRRCVVGWISVQRRVPSSERSPIDDVYLLDLVDRIRGNFGFVVLWILCVIVSIAPE